MDDRRTRPTAAVHLLPRRRGWRRMHWTGIRERGDGKNSPQTPRHAQVAIKLVGIQAWAYLLVKLANSLSTINLADFLEEPIGIAQRGQPNLVQFGGAVKMQVHLVKPFLADQLV